MPACLFSRPVSTSLIRSSLLSTLGALLIFGTAGSAEAADKFFLGTWTISKAVVAPWADPARKPDDTEMKSLVGKTMAFKTDRITGPHIVACSSVKYEVSENGPEMLFQGALAQKQDGSPQDPAKPAADLGFKGTSIKLLQTGCENELDYGFVDEKTAEFGLNDYVYILTRQ